jgi:replicative DNA helicase Mcm
MVNNSTNVYNNSVRLLELLEYNLTNLTTLSYLSNLTILTNKEKILLILLSPNSISNISKELDINIKTVNASVYYQERNTGLLIDDLVEIVQESPRLYKTTEKGRKRLLEFIEKENERRELENNQIQRQEDIREEMESLEDFIRDLYKDLIDERVRKGKSWVCFDFKTVAKQNVMIAESILEDPGDVINKIEIIVQSFFNKKIEIKFKNLPTSQKILIGEIRKKHINKLYSFDGVIKQTSQVQPLITSTKYECPSCGTLHQVLQKEQKIITPSKCSCSYKGKFKLVSQELIDLQTLYIEEQPEELKGRTNPQKILVLLKSSLTDAKLQPFYNPGSRIRINGVVKVEPVIQQKDKQTKTKLSIEANYIEPQEKSFNYVPTEEERVKIRELSKKDNYLDILCNSFCPDLKRINTQKLGILISLVKGSVHKNIKRQNIHILLAGEPGMAKSELLKGVIKLFNFARYANGASSSSVGLTASVVKDDFTGMWSLSAGAVVMSHNGVVCIDEIDKLRDEDKNDLNECLEQGTVTINKAGISGSLQANTTGIMACNPESHKFTNDKDYLAQLNLPFALITRFDLIFILKNSDENMRELFSELMKEVDSTTETISEELLSKYILTARQTEPILTEEARTQILWRMDGMIGLKTTQDKNITLTVRQLHAMIRISGAFAKLRLSTDIEEQDVDNAWELYVKSINSTSPHSQVVEEQKVLK